MSPYADSSIAPVCAQKVRLIAKGWDLVRGLAESKVKANILALCYKIARGIVVTQALTPILQTTT